MANETKYINLSDDTNVSVSTKLYVDKYNKGELAKSVDLKVTELIKPLPDVNLNLVPKPVYDAEVQLNEDLQAEIEILNITIDDLTSELAIKTADSASLVLENDALRLKEAKSDNNIQSIQTTVLDLRTNLTTSLTKAINEATEKTALEAENGGLSAQKNALIKQIDTLNNLLAQANASLAVAQQALSAKAQAVAAGGQSTGELATIVFDAGDISKWKEPNHIYLDAGDWGGKHGPNYAGDPLGYYPQGNNENAVKYFDVVAGPKDITVNLSFSGNNVNGPITVNPFDMSGITFPVSLKANETKRFDMNKVNKAWTQNGAYDVGFWVKSWNPSKYNMDMKIEVKDKDAGGKTESKVYALTIYKYWKP